MLHLVFLVAFLGQVPAPPAPSPIFGSAPSPGIVTLDEDTQRQKEWLLANLITSLNFDTAKMEEVQRRLDRMSPSQIRILVQVYQTKLEERNQMLAVQRKAYEDSVMAQAQLNLQRAQAYRDHLKREYDYTITVKQQEIELMRRATEYQNWMLQNSWNNWGWNRPYYHRRW